jgi:hypothetical protein
MPNNFTGFIEEQLVPGGTFFPALASIDLGNVADGTAIPVTNAYASVNITTAAAETNTLAIPTILGQRLVINLNVRAVGDRVITAASAINVAGNTIMTFGAVRDCIELVAIQLAGVLVWEVVWNNNVALS